MVRSTVCSVVCAVVYPSANCLHYISVGKKAKLCVDTFPIETGSLF